MTFGTRISRGTGPDGLNLEIIPFDQRPDWDASKMKPDTIIWRVRDIFTTHNGSWEVAPEVQLDKSLDLSNESEAQDAGLFSIPQWARDDYLFEPWHPKYNTEGGADHDIHVCVEGTDGIRFVGAGVLFTSDGPQYLQPPNPTYVTMMRTKSHGWTNLTMYPGSVCYPPAHGPWSVAKLSDVAAADVVVGVGLPGGWHVSTFIVVEGIPWSEYQTSTGTLTDILLAKGEEWQVIQFNPDAALQKRIFAAGFVPNSPEFYVTKDGVTYVAQRAEHMGTGEVRVYYCQHGVWDHVMFVRRE